METIRLIIVEDNLSIAETLRDYFSLQEEFFVVASTVSIEELQKIDIGNNKPDIILMDIMLPGMNGIEGVSVVFKRWPTAKVVMNSVLEDSDSVYESLKAGALGYITKDIPLSDIKNALLIVNAGGSFMNARIARKVVNFFHEDNSVKEKLTEKEWTIAHGIKDGKSYKMIAAECDMTIDGVRFYTQKIYRKLNVNSRGELAAILYKHK
ncbi:MAG: response regulator transcription factor [Chitinophagaceae bacterium]